MQANVKQVLQSTVGAYVLTETDCLYRTESSDLIPRRLVDNELLQNRGMCTIRNNKCTVGFDLSVLFECVLNLLCP